MRYQRGIRLVVTLVVLTVTVPTTILTLAQSASSATPTCTSIHVEKRYSQHSYRYMRIPSTSSGATSCLLAQGNSGDGVYTLQRNLHYCYDSGLAVDSSFGPATASVLKQAQRAAGVTADGVYGPVTRDAIRFAVFTSNGGGDFVACEKVWA